MMMMMMMMMMIVRMRIRMMMMMTSALGSGVGISMLSLSLYLSCIHMPTFLVIAHVPDSLEDTEDDHIQSGRLFYGMTTYNRLVNKL